MTATTPITRRRRDVVDPSTAKVRRTLSPLLLRDHAAAALLGVSRSTFHKLRRQGLVPMPAIRTAGLARWSAQELRQWVEAGCPNVETWLRLRAETAQGVA